MPRFMFEGPQQCTIFCSVLIHYAWVMYAKRFYWLVPQSVVNSYCVLCAIRVKKESKNIQQRTLLSFITIPLY